MQDAGRCRAPGPGYPEVESPKLRLEGEQVEAPHEERGRAGRGPPRGRGAGRSRPPPRLEGGQVKAPHEGRGRRGRGPPSGTQVGPRPLIPSPPRLRGVVPGLNHRKCPSALADARRRQAHHHRPAVAGCHWRQPGVPTSPARRGSEQVAERVTPPRGGVVLAGVVDGRRDLPGGARRSGPDTSWVWRVIATPPSSLRSTVPSPYRCPRKPLVEGS